MELVLGHLYRLNGNLFVAELPPVRSHAAPLHLQQVDPDDMTAFCFPVGLDVNPDGSLAWCDPTQLAFTAPLTPTSWTLNDLRPLPAHD